MEFWSQFYWWSAVLCFVVMVIEDRVMNGESTAAGLVGAVAYAVIPVINALAAVIFTVGIILDEVESSRIRRIWRRK